MGSRLEGRHALVTGGGSGIGAATARALASAGAKVTVVGRRYGPLEALSQELGGGGIQCDVTNPASIDNAFAMARAACGPIHILVVNAGTADSAAFERTSRETWDWIMAVNLTAAFDCARAGLPDLLASDGGRLVFVASVAGLRGVPYAAAYSASKHGVLGLMRSLATEFAKTSLTVNAVCPGFVDTPMTQQSAERIVAKTGRTEEQALAAITAMNANGRLVSPEAVATMIATLCLPESRDVNGAAITIDGGTSA